MNKLKIALIGILLCLCLGVGFGSVSIANAEETIAETIKTPGPATADDETTQSVETSNVPEESTKKEETTEEETENDNSEKFIITQEELDKIIEAAKSGNVDEVKNLLIGSIGFTSFVVLMALIYFVKSKVKYIKESKLLLNATNSTDEKIKALAEQIETLTGGISDKLDDVEIGVKKYYQALNNEKVEEANKKAQEIAKALEEAMTLNQGTTSGEETQETTPAEGSQE